MNIFAQTGTITGTVIDKNSEETLPGANIIIEGTTTGVSTDISGKFIISDIPPGEINLIASFIGYKSVTKKVVVVANQTTEVNFSIAEDNMMLDEIVVVGYGTKRKRDITSSITSVKSKEIQDIQIASFESAFQGKAAGVQVTSDNGIAGNGVTIRVRGTSSVLSSSEPLYVVDGIPIISGSFLSTSGFPEKSNALSQIDPTDIENIQILKDASAAAIYGARGANGVVLITTKSGKSGKTKFSAGYSIGMQDVTNRLDNLNSADYLKYTKEAWFNSNMGTEEEYYQNLPYSLYDPALSFEENKAKIDNTSTDWVDEELRIGLVEKANLSASGGNDKTIFYIGGAYYQNKGVIENNDFERMSGKIKIDHKASENLKIGGTIGLTRTVNNRVSTSWAGGLGTAQSRALPIMPVRNPDGTYFAPSSGVNTVAERENLDYEATALSIISNVFAEYRIYKDLSFRTEFGLNNIYQKENKYEGTITTREDARAEDRRYNLESWTSSSTFNYNKTFENNHNVTGMIGFSASQDHQYLSEFWGEQFPNPSLTNPGNATKQGGWSDEQNFAFISYFGRASYNFKKKYYADFSIRRDGSSRFGKDNKYGVFPSTSVGWILTEEEFMKDMTTLTFFKLRASYGIVGNAGIGNYEYFGTFSTNKYNGQPGIGLENIENPNLGWEETEQTDIGFDFGLWEGRISGGFDYYIKNTHDLLLNINVPQTSGANSVTDNVGKLENKGIEFFITSTNLQGKLKWITDFNIGYNKNEIIDIEGQIIEGETFGNNYAQEGHPIGAWRLVEFAGVDPETGEELFVLADGSIGLWDDEDAEFFSKNAKVTGNPYPEWFGGITNTLTYKGFDFSILFTFSFGNNVYRDDGKFFEGGNIGSNWNQMQTIENRWQNPGDQTDIPQLLWESTYSTHNSTRYLEKGDYARLKSLTFGYTLPKNISQKLYMDKVRVYFTGQNILTFTDYPGWDPEVNRDGSKNITAGTTYLSPPQVKSFTFGINIDF